MAPPKSSRAVGDDHKPDSGSGSKEKGNGPTSAKMRRGASQSSASQLREAAVAAPTSAPSQSTAEAQAPTVGYHFSLSLVFSTSWSHKTYLPLPVLTCMWPLQINWSSFERDALHSYRREHQLNTPASFASKFHQWVLSRPGSIGHYSPTMIRKQKARRQSKDDLAKSVRKHFNGLGIQENDVIVDLIFKVRSEKTARAGGPNRQPGIISDH